MNMELGSYLSRGCSVFISLTSSPFQYALRFDCPCSIKPCQIPNGCKIVVTSSWIIYFLGNFKKKNAAMFLWSRSFSRRFERVQKMLTPNMDVIKFIHCSLQEDISPIGWITTPSGLAFLSSEHPATEHNTTVIKIDGLHQNRSVPASQEIM